jgi:hypothetical protein
MPQMSSTVQDRIAALPGLFSVPAGSSRRRVLLLLLSLTLVTIVLLRGIHKGEFSENVDETVHACTGLYVASFLHDLPLRHPVEYTYRYYAQYPSLGIVMYPPAFYLIEGLAFFIFGPSVVTARLTILVIALVGFFFWFKLVNELEDEYTAALSTVLLAFMPSVLNYAKTVMLDVPLMSFCIAASYFWIVYLRRGLSRDLYWFAAFFSLAFLTKQHAIYLVLWCPVTLAVLRKWERILNWKFGAAAVLSCLIVAPAYILQIVMNRSLALNLEGTAANASMQWGYYWGKLPYLIGWGAIVASAIGVLLSLWKGKKENTVLMLSWIACCYIVFTLIRHKDAEGRYILYWVPAFAYFAVAPFIRVRSTPLMRVSGTALVAILLTWYGVRAWNYQRLYVSGYAQAARQLTKLPGGCVLVDIELAGNFTFFMRALDPARRFVILRKALYETRTVREWGVTEFAHNRSEVAEVLKKDSVEYIVVENNMPLHFSSQQPLRDIVEHSGDYRELATVPIESNMSYMQNRSLTLYESRVPVTAPHGMLHIKMENLPHDIDIPFEQLTGK